MVCFENAVMVPVQRLQELGGIVEVWVSGSSRPHALIAVICVVLFVAQVLRVMSRELWHVVSREWSASPRSG